MEAFAPIFLFWIIIIFVSVVTKNSKQNAGKKGSAGNAGRLAKSAKSRGKRLPPPGPGKACFRPAASKSRGRGGKKSSSCS